MDTIRRLAEQLWRGEVSAEERHPFQPLMALEEIAPGVAFLSSLANVTAIATDAGLLLVDVGGYLFGDFVRSALRGWSQVEVALGIYTHGHIDHVFGIVELDAEAQAKNRPRPHVIAHRAVPARFDRYRLTAGYNGCINARQFGAALSWPTRYRDPDELYDDERVLELAGERVELHHARGETDDATWVWLPGRKLLCTGDLFIWATPNAGNPQKVQRYPGEWAAALRKMALLGAEVLCPGHGVPIFGAARIRQALSETAEWLEHLHAGVLAKMNEGRKLDEIRREVSAPPHLADRPYLQPIYDEPEFVVRNLWRLYGGWYDGNPAHLKPPAEPDLAKEVVGLAGGAARLRTRALALLAQGDLPLASQLIEWARAAAPDDPAVRAARAEIYRAREKSERSLMARGIFRAAADE